LQQKCLNLEHGNLNAHSETAFRDGLGICNSTKEIRRPNGWLVDPGLAGEPVVIDLTDWATSIAEKDYTPLESLVIGLEASWDRAARLRTLDHDHTHARLP
jgi:hypothetical protein